MARPKPGKEPKPARPTLKKVKPENPRQAQQRKERDWEKSQKRWAARGSARRVTRVWGRKEAAATSRRLGKKHRR